MGAKNDIDVISGREISILPEFLTEEEVVSLKIVMILASLLFCATLFAQPPDTLWTKSFGGNGHDIGLSVQQSSDGGYIIAAYTEPFGAGNGNGDVWLIRTNAGGDTLWTKSFGAAGADLCWSVQETLDGGYVMTGFTQSLGAEPFDAWLIKTDVNGDTLWTKTFGGSNTDMGYSVRWTLDGGFIITGLTYSFGLGNSDIWLIKTDASGDTLWTKTFGGSYFDAGYSVQQTTDGGYIIVGETWSFGSGSNDAWLIKTDANGDTLWNKIFGGSSNDVAYSVQQTTDGGYIISGSQSFGAGASDLWLIKTDASGDTQWTRTFGGTGSDNAGLSSVEQTSDGGYIIAGSTESYGAGSSDVWLIKTDANGDTLWTKTLGGTKDDWGNSIHLTSDGGYIITGGTQSFGDSTDIWLIRVATDITEIDEVPKAIVDDHWLEQNYPNPFNPATHIRFQLPNTSDVQIKVYNTLGQEVAVLLDERKPAGSHLVTFDGSNLGSGVYVYRLQAGEFQQAKKMLLIR